MCWAMGLTQHRQAVATIREIVNTMLLRGSIGRRGAGLCPVRGHSNVQGDRTMGIVERPSEALLDALAARFAFIRRVTTATTPWRRSRRWQEARSTCSSGSAATSPRRRRTRRRQRRRSNVCADGAGVDEAQPLACRCGEEALILPCLGSTEVDRRRGRRSFVTVEDSMGIVHATRGANEPASSHLRSEVEIVCAVAAATLGDRPVDWPALATDYDAYASTSPRRSRGSPTSTSGSANPAASPFPTRRATARRSRRRPARRALGQRFAPVAVRRGDCSCRRCDRTTSSTRRSTGSTTAIAACREAGGSCSSTPTTLTISASLTATSSTSSASGSTAASAAPGDSGSSPTRRAG